MTKDSIYHIKHMYIQPFTTLVDWPEMGRLMEVSAVFYICRYCGFLYVCLLFFTWYGRYAQVLSSVDSWRSMIQLHEKMGFLLLFSKGRSNFVTVVIVAVLVVVAVVIGFLLSSSFLHVLSTTLLYVMLIKKMLLPEPRSFQAVCLMLK